MNLNTLKLVEDVAALGSFAAVARAQDQDPSRISRQIAALEDELGLRLFQRSTRRLALTDEGRSFLARAAPAVAEIEAARDGARAGIGQASGLVRLATSTAFGEKMLVPLVPRMREALPDIRLDLMLSDETVDLIDAQVDLAIRLAPMPEGDLISRKLRATRYHICASPEWIAAQGKPSAPEVLAEIDCLRYALPGLRTVWKLRDRRGAIHEVPVQGSLSISSPLALLSACRGGLGPAMLADWLAGGAMEAGELVDLFPGYLATATEFETAAWLLYPSKTHLPLRVRAVIDFLVQELGD